MCAVSYLNTVPLVWGLTHGPQRGEFELDFALPSECAARLAGGRADIGLPPVAVLLDQELTIFQGAGIACRGPVRTILLISKVPFARVRTLATDAGSRTSVLLSRIVLAGHGAEPSLASMPPDLRTMLEVADAALVIGDAALRLNPAALRDTGLYVADLGEEWVNRTGLPMVFAVWAGRSPAWSAERERVFVDSARYGLEHIDEIAQAESEKRGVTTQLARDYLTHNLVLELGDAEYRGLQRFLSLARELGPAEPIPAAAAREE